jgi:hypothetical protein
MSIYSKLRRTIVSESKVFKIKNFLNENDDDQIEIDNPEYYNVETDTLKLGDLCLADIKRGIEGNIRWNNANYTTFCALLQLSNTIPTDLKNRLHTDLDEIYNFLRKDLKIGNLRKFHSLVKVVFNHENPANTFNLIADYIRNHENIDEIKRTLDLFRGSDVAEAEIEEFLKKAKFTQYKEYENSFIGDHFIKKEYKLTLVHKTEEENRTIKQLISDILRDKITTSEVVKHLYRSILSNYKAEDMIKGDLVCIKPLLSPKGDVIIIKNDVVEVKKLDSGGDSYLSEFFAIYKQKQSDLPEEAYNDPRYLKVYNEIIDRLYLLFNRMGGNILENIKNNFAGIIYEDNLFVKSDDIDLYWSNKGRNNCTNDHRLSIRYRINKSEVDGYIYEKNKDLLIEKPVSVKLDKEKYVCPILKPKKISENYQIKQISSLLTEGRKEDARAKYEDVEDDVFNYYVDNDPSGNQKYLDWMLNNVVGIYRGRLEPNLMEMVKFFHQYQNMFIEKDINRHNLITLDREIDDVKEKLLQKEKKKQAKKQSTKLYEDDRWLAISPKSWEASCYYGAGTKWCVTMKDNRTYWNKYSKNATFIFIIDKIKTQEDPLYKVAYRIIGRSGKYELWNAPDYEISKAEDGLRYFNELPEELKERALRLHQENLPPSEGRPEWVDVDPRAQALLNQLNEVDIEDVEDYWYGLSVYQVDEDYYAVGSASEVDEAIRNHYDEYTDEDLMSYHDYEGYYLSMNDQDSFIDGEVEDYTDGLSENELLEISGFNGDMETIEDELRGLRDELDSLDSEEDSERIDEIEDEISTLEFSKDDLIERAKERVSRFHRGDWESCLSDGPVNCLVNDKGWFRNARELYESGLVDLDRYALLENVVENAEYDVIGSYGYDESQDDDDYYWYIYRIDY